MRAAAAAADAVRNLAERLVGAGPTVPDGARTTVAAGVRQVRIAAVIVLTPGAVALLMPAPSAMPRHLVALWSALPLALTLNRPALARGEFHSCSRRASPAGQRLLGALTRRIGGSGDDRAYLASVAVRGIRAVGRPDLRAAFAHREDREPRD